MAVTYFLPMSAGLRKGWGKKFSDFFCCHGTLVQANAAHNRYLYYVDDDSIYTGVYASSKDVGIKFIPLKNIGYERYQIYFPVEE